MDSLDQPISDMTVGVGWRRTRSTVAAVARSRAGQLDVSPFPEVLRAQRRHLAQLHHPWRLGMRVLSQAR